MNAEVLDFSMDNENKNLALEGAISQIEKNFGKGSVMKLGENDQNIDIQSISMYLPGDSFYNNSGVEKPVASFRFIDLYNLFKSMPKEAIWYNERNIAQHKNLGDAFLLRLFKGIIVKVANADDIRVSELYSKSRKEGIMASFKVEQDLMEWEANLWEY